MIDESGRGGAKAGSKTPPLKAGGSPLMGKRRVPPQPPLQLKTPEAAGGIDSSSSPSVNALRNKFGARVSRTTSPPASPVSPVTRTNGLPPRRVGESRVSSTAEKFSSPTPSGPTVVVNEQAPSRGDSPSLTGNQGNNRSTLEAGGGGRSNVDSGFISEVPDDLSTVGQVTSNENVSEEVVTPPTPLSPESQSDKPVVEEVWDEARVSDDFLSLHVHAHTLYSGNLLGKKI